VTTNSTEPRKITINVQGVAITGRIVERSAVTLEVELLDPFGRLTDGRSVISAARPYVSYDDAYGEDVAVQILGDLYRAASFVAAHGEELRHRWAVTRPQLHEGSGTIVRSRAELIEARSKSRRMLREGEITADDHEGWMIELASSWEEYRSLAEDAAYEMFSGLRVDMSLGLLAQIMRHIDPKFESTYEDVA
jgi:hypothetical protein